MKPSGSRCLLLVVEEDCLRVEGWYGKVGIGIDGAFGAGLSALEGIESNIEEVDQAEVLIVSATARVGRLEGSRMSLVGMSWRAVSAPAVLAFSQNDLSSSPYHSSLLISEM